MKTNKRTSLLCSLICMSFYGCSFYADLYFLNRSDKPVNVLMHFERPVIERKGTLVLDLLYADSILKVGDKTRSLLGKKLGHTLIDANTISVTLPAHSTLLLGGAYNKPIYADSIFLNNSDFNKAYSVKDFTSKLQRGGGLFPPFHYTYEVAGIR